jgi:hypothetical protein
MKELLVSIVDREQAAYERIRQSSSRRSDPLLGSEAARAWGRLQLARELLSLVEQQEAQVPEVFTRAWEDTE